MSPLTASSLYALIPPVQWIVDLLHPVLLFFHDSIGVGWGMSIVLLTVCVRAVLTPLMVKQFKSMKAMVSVAPELKKLQAKYKDDKQRQQQEVMKFYAENKINPFASCLPLVAQMPFFIGLFYLLQSDLRRDICGRAIESVSTSTPCAKVADAIVGQEDFLFIPDLTVKATGWVLAVLIVMYICSQLLSSVLTPSTGDRNQKMLMYALPFVFVFFVINFPSGLIVYWITTNLWTVGQGYVLRTRLGPIAPPKDGAPALAGIPGSKSDAGEGFMARLAGLVGSPREPDPDPDPVASKPSRNGAPRAKQQERVGAKSGSGPKSGSGGGKAKAKAAGTGGAVSPKPARTTAPPPSPRKKKKRSGRRR